MKRARQKSASACSSDMLLGCAFFGRSLGWSSPELQFPVKFKMMAEFDVRKKGGGVERAA